MTHQFDNVGSEGAAAPSHTPGPWTVGTDPEDPDYFNVWFDTQGTGAEIAGRIGEEANARLIAAAPDLLAALDDIVSCCDANDGDSLANAVNAARAAIARAKGE